jgi:hypothetical protein
MTTKLKKKQKAVRLSTYRVWLEQVNQTYVDVRALDEEDARDKGYRKWRREYAGTSISSVQLIEPKKAQ